MASYFFLFLFLAARYYILGVCFCIVIVHMYCSICILLPMIGCCYLLLGWLSKVVAKLHASNNYSFAVTLCYTIIQLSENQTNVILCDPLSENLHSSHNFQFFLFSKHYLQCLRSGYSKFQLNQASSFEVIALDSQASKKIDLYSNHTENKLQALTFATIT